MVLPLQAQLHAIDRSRACRYGLSGFSSAVLQSVCVPAELRSWRNPAMVSVWALQGAQRWRSIRPSLDRKLPRSTVRSSVFHKKCIKYLQKSLNHLPWGRAEPLCWHGYSLSGESGHTAAPSGTGLKSGKVSLSLYQGTRCKQIRSLGGGWRACLLLVLTVP